MPKKLKPFKNHEAIKNILHHIATSYFPTTRYPPVNHLFKTKHSRAYELHHSPRNLLISKYSSASILKTLSLSPPSPFIDSPRENVFEIASCKVVRGCSWSEWNPSLPKNKQTSRYIYRTYSFVCGGGIGDKSKRWNRFSGKETPGNPLFVLPAGQISYSLLSIENEDHCRCSISLPRACLHRVYHTVMLVHLSLLQPFLRGFIQFFSDFSSRTKIFGFDLTQMFLDSRINLFSRLF